jgi:hypothetical protein
MIFKQFDEFLPDGSRGAKDACPYFCAHDGFGSLS